VNGTFIENEDKENMMKKIEEPAPLQQPANQHYATVPSLYPDSKLCSEPVSCEKIRRKVRDAL
jgi:hypothetical protein